MSAAATAVCAVLLCLCAGLALSMRKNRNNADGVYAKALFQGKSLRVAPVRSLVYAFFAATVLCLGLLAADKASGYETYLRADTRSLMMNFERYTSNAFSDYAGGSSYQLVMVKGSEIPPKDKPRILVLGDSFVWGDGLTNINQTWWSLMARALERRGYGCEVYAAAYEDTSTYDELVWLRESTLLEDIQPDLIVMGYVYNDPDLKSLGLGPPFYFPAMYSPGRHSPLLLTLCPGVYCFLEERFTAKIGRTENRFNNAETGYTWLAVCREYAQPPWINNFDQYAVRPLGEFIAQRGIPLIVIPTPESPNRWLYEPHNQNIMPLFERAGLPVFNPFEPFAAYCAGDSQASKYMHVNPRNPHPGPATTAFLANYAADVLEREYASILGEKRTQGKAYPIEINDWLPYMLALRASIEGERASQYVIEYPDQSSEPDFENYDHGNFLAWPLRKKHVKLNFKYPVRLSRVIIEGTDLLSAEVWTLGINRELGFDDQRPVKLPNNRSGGGVHLFGLTKVTAR